MSFSTSVQGLPNTFICSLNLPLFIFYQNQEVLHSRDFSIYLLKKDPPHLKNPEAWNNGITSSNSDFQIAYPKEKSIGIHQR